MQIVRTSSSGGRPSRFEYSTVKWPAKRFDLPIAASKKARMTYIRVLFYFVFNPLSRGSPDLGWRETIKWGENLHKRSNFSKFQLKRRSFQSRKQALLSLSKQLAFNSASPLSLSKYLQQPSLNHSSNRNFLPASLCNLSSLQLLNWKIDFLHCQTHFPNSRYLLADGRPNAD